MNEKEIRYFSMFTGVGGFELGLERAKNNILQQNYEQENGKSGHQTSYQEGECDEHTERTKWQSTTIFTPIGFSEIDKYANELLKKRFPNVTNYGDCTKINPNELPDFDLLCGGFPCQAFSIAGKRKGFNDTRGTLFFEIARILEVKRPKNILLENVKGLLNHEKGKTFKIILQTLDELGYETQWMVLNSKFFGVPQNRERVFIIGSLRGERRSEILPFRESYKESFGETNQQGCTNSLSQQSAGGYNRRGNYIKSEHGHKIDYQNDVDNIEFVPQDNRIYSNKGVSPPMATGNNQGKLIQSMKIRRLTPIECERLQGFPDNWTEGFSDTQRYKMMGNAVTVNVIKSIAEKLI